jgi:uncharacterized RDD family membrane protein YckC
MADPAHEIEAPTYAGFWKRLAAYLIDSIIVGMVVSIIASIFGIPLVSTTPQPPTPEEIALMVFAILITWLYFALMESSKKQGTLGKMALGIIVTDEDGHRASFARATARYFAKIISGLILMIGYLMAGWTQKKQALHDMLANTLVINK